MTITQRHTYISVKELPLLKPWYISFTHGQFWHDTCDVFEFSCPVFLFHDQCHYVPHSHIQSCIYIFGGNMNSQGHCKIPKDQTTNICSPKKRTLQNICSLKKGTLQNICSPKKRTLQNICSPKKRRLQNICSLKKRTLQNICSPKKQTLQTFVVSKSGHYKIFVVPKADTTKYL